MAIGANPVQRMQTSLPSDDCYTSRQATINSLPLLDPRPPYAPSKCRSMCMCLKREAELKPKRYLFWLEPHPKMPNMSLSRKEADDRAAYIAEQPR